MANNESIKDYYTLGERVVVAKKDHIEEIVEVVTTVDDTIQQHAEEAEQRLVDIETDISNVDKELDDHDAEAEERFTDIEGRLTALSNEMTNVKKSVSDGKVLVANAITGKGISTATDAEFEVMATNIASIVTLENGTGDGTITAGDVLSGKIGYSKGVKVEGTMADNGAVSQTLAANGSYTIPAGYHNGEGKVTQSLTGKAAATYTPGTSNQTIAANQWLTGAQTIKGDANLVSANIKSGVSIFGVSGNSNVVDTSGGDATAAQILSGKKAYVDGKLVTGSIASQGAQTITPGTANKTIASGKYLSGTQTIKGDANLVAGNIKKGTSIFGVTGTYDPVSSLIKTGSVTIAAGGTGTIPRGTILSDTIAVFTGPTTNVGGTPITTYYQYGFGTGGSTTYSDGWGAVSTSYYATISSIDSSNITIAVTNKYPCTIYYKYYSSNITHTSLNVSKGSNFTLDINKVLLESAIAKFGGTHRAYLSASGSSTPWVKGSNSDYISIYSSSESTITFKVNGDSDVVMYYSYLS